MVAVDVGILASLWLPSDQTGLAEKVYARDPIWIAPLVWRSDFREEVAQYLRRGLSFETALESIKHAESLMKGHEYPVDSPEVMGLVRSSGCSARECEYVYVAMSRDIPLVTLFPQVLHKFPGIAIHPQEFIQLVS